MPLTFGLATGTLTMVFETLQRQALFIDTSYTVGSWDTFSKVAH